jgi:signal transduction histidine kinase
LHYQTISLILIIFLLTFSFLIEGKISKLVIIAVFTLVIVYGYFFNKSTDKIIKANFAQRKANEALEELTEGLEGQVEQRTKELKEAYGELKKLDKAKSEFISIASHQLRTPLTAIKGYISMMLEKSYGKPPTKMEKPLENIYASNERLIKLVNDLLNVSRIEAGRTEMNFEKVALDEIITSVIEELKGVADKKNIYLKFKKPQKPLPKILADRDKIRQVIINIVDNAIRYTEKGGVTIKCKVQNGKCKIEITDTGEGMTKEEISHLFESFSRGTAGTRFWTEGAGLGLYIAKKFIDFHKGKIWAESPGEGKGSTFYIELPMI